jgi:16S rRNA U1498 N3-methylase RsmE
VERDAFDDAGWRAASLGPNLLRFETAGIAGLTLARAMLRST